jgi:hypothetical protein
VSESMVDKMRKEQKIDPRQILCRGRSIHSYLIYWNEFSFIHTYFITASFVKKN